LLGIDDDLNVGTALDRKYLHWALSGSEPDRAQTLGIEFIPVYNFWVPSDEVSHSL
jgi:hypothetical protein